MSDTIGDFLGVAVIEEEIKEKAEKTINEIEIANKDARFSEASEYVNKNLKEIIDTSMESLSGLFGVMADSQDPKMYQVGASFIKTLSEINKTYYEVNKPVGGVTSNTKTDGSTPTQNIQINNSEVKLISTNDLLD